MIIKINNKYEKLDWVHYPEECIPKEVHGKEEWTYPTWDLFSENFGLTISLEHGEYVLWGPTGKENEIFKIVYSTISTLFFNTLEEAQCKAIDFFTNYDKYKNLLVFL